MNPNLRLQVRCAGCGRDKASANHWFLVKLDNHGNLYLRPLGQHLAKRDQPACGQQCVQKLIERWFASVQERVQRDPGPGPRA